MRPKLVPEADAEFEEAAHWYHRRAGLGEAFIEAVIDALIEIERHPRRFPPLSGLPADDVHEIRRYLLDRFPYAIIYWVKDKKHVIVLAVAHAKRRPGYWRDRFPE